MSVTEGRLQIDYASLHLVDQGVELGHDFRTIEGDSGLVMASPGYALIIAGNQIGPVSVYLDVRTSVPPLELEAWDEVAEITVETGEAGQMSLIAGMNYNTLPGNPNLTPAGPGSYRLLAKARGRSRSYDLAECGPQEFSLAIWPAPPAPEVVHKTSDQTGADWRVVMAGHRTA